MIDGRQCVAARGLLGWSQKQLSDAVSQQGGKFSVMAITAFEKGRAIRKSNEDLLIATLEAAGIEFIPENGGGVGVRLREP